MQAFIFVIFVTFIPAVVHVDREVSEYRRDREYQAVQRQMDAYYAWDEVRYFPEGELGGPEAHSASYFLAAMDEPVLKTLDTSSGGAAVRLTVVASFGPVFAFRVQASGDSAEAVRKIGWTRYGDWGPVDETDVRQVPIDRSALDRVLETARHVGPCTYRRQNLYFDGAYWVLEVAQGDQYCATMEQSPSSVPWTDVVRELRGVLPEEQAETEPVFEFWSLARPE